ncbi:hypothetical protein EDB86DRAFT_3088667 [Lactarius hatsudake]|nr:hypothetical protein EDB86DRAFT_3088667 [Lactarius hatsudake]
MRLQACFCGVRRAVANAARKGSREREPGELHRPELLNKYVGKSERAVRQLDAPVPQSDEALSESSARVVNALLTELDGLDARCVRPRSDEPPDMLDPAMCRPGRLDKLLYVDRPARASGQCHGDIGGEGGEGYSGADLAALVREAGVKALRRALGSLRETDGGAAGPEPEGVVVQVEDF